MALWSIWFCFAMVMICLGILPYTEALLSEAKLFSYSSKSCCDLSFHIF
jgi:hypothetical protein